MSTAPLPAAPPVRLRAARWISIAGHPFVLVILLVAAAALPALPLARALAVIAVVGLVMIVPMVLHVRRQVRAGRYTDFDVSVRGQRTRMYPFALALSLPLLGAMAAIGAPRPMIAGALASAALLAVAAAVNSVLKVSLHTAFAVFAAVTLAALSPWLAAGTAALAVLVGWSRTVLGRHSWAEVLIGAVLGGLAGAALVAV